MDLRGKRLAVLGGRLISCQFLEAARNLGVRTTVIDYYEPSREESPAKLMSDDHALISVADVDEVARFLVDNEFDGVITGYTDSILGFYADICQKAGLPCYGTREQFEIFTDKHRWKELCRKHAIPTALEYGPEILDMPEEEIDFPIFVKPSDASGARGATVAHDKAGLLLAYELAKGFQRNGEVLFERYLDGPEVTVFWVFLDGEYYVNMVGNRHVKHNQEGVIPLPAGYTFPSSVIPTYLEEVAPKWREAFSELGIRDGMMFMQCSVLDGLPYVYDVGYRTTGSLEHHLQRAVAGYSTTDMLIHFALTGRMTDDPVIVSKVARGLYAPCLNVSWLMRPGIVGSFDGLCNLEANDSVVKYEKNHLEGEIIPPEAVGELRQIALRALATCASAKDIPAVALRVQSEADVLDPEGNSLLLPGMEESDFVGRILGTDDAS